VRLCRGLRNQAAVSYRWSPPVHAKMFEAPHRHQEFLEVIFQPGTKKSSITASGHESLELLGGCSL